MNLHERVKLVKAMEFICRQINDEEIFENWLIGGVADGDIEYSDLSATDLAQDEATYYACDDNTFADIMAEFLACMTYANYSGGLYCDDVCSGSVYDNLVEKEVEVSDGVVVVKTQKERNR